MTPHPAPARRPGARCWSPRAPDPVRRPPGPARRYRYAGAVSRDADREHVPAPMRHNVRLLGRLLGDVLRESGGQDLLDDTERLRHAVIAARHPGSADALVGEIADLVASWPLERAEAVAHAFTVSTSPTWPRSTSGSGRCAAGTRPVPRPASHWPPRSPRCAATSASSRPT